MFPNSSLTLEEKQLFRRLKTPAVIQDYLNTLSIHRRDAYWSPRRVLREKKAQCLEGAALAAAVLWFHGHPPLLLDLKSADHDSDHVVALFRQRGRWGALSKTNHAVLRFREPVYQSVRELAMSYFHEYFLHTGEKTMISYSLPFDVRKIKRDWVTSEESLEDVAVALDRIRHSSIASSATRKTFRAADPLEISAGRLVEWKRSR